MVRALPDAGTAGRGRTALDPRTRRSTELDRRVPSIALRAGAQNLGADLGSAFGIASRRNRSVDSSLIRGPRDFDLGPGILTGWRYLSYRSASRCQWYWNIRGPRVKGLGGEEASRQLLLRCLDASSPPRPSRSDVEPNSLSQRQLRAPVDGVRLAPHVRLPGIRARLPAAARVFLAAEGAADFGPRSAEIDVGDTAIAAVGGEEALRHLQSVGEDRRRQAVGHGVLDGHRLVQGVVGNHVQNRRKGFGTNHAHAGVGANDGRFHEIAGPREGLSAAQQL